MDRGSKNERIEFGSNDREQEGPQVLYRSIENKHAPTDCKGDGLTHQEGCIHHFLSCSSGLSANIFSGLKKGRLQLLVMHMKPALHRGHVEAFFLEAS